MPKVNMTPSLFSAEETLKFSRHLPAPVVAEYRPPTDFPDFSRAQRLCLDLETHDPDLHAKGPGFRRGSYIVGAALATDDRQLSAYYPMRHLDGPNCDAVQVERWLRDGLKHFRGELVGANVALYDGDALQCAEIHAPEAQWRDVQWAEPLLDESAGDYHLSTLAKKYGVGEKLGGWLQEIYGKDVIKHFREVHPAHAERYALSDVALPLAILDKQLPLLEAEGLTGLYQLECRLAPLLLYMRRMGVRVDLEKAEAAEKMLAERRDRHLQALTRLVGMVVDPDSGPSLAAACEKLGIVYPRTEKNNPSFQALWLKQQLTDEEVTELALLAPDRADQQLFFTHLLAARKYEKARNPFLTNYILGSHVNGFLHPEFHPLRGTDGDDSFKSRGARTGRFSSSHPNCFDGETELLTFRGWIRLPDLQEDDAVAQWEEGRITFVQPTQTVAYTSTDPLCHYSNQHIDLALTPDHRCLLRNRKTLKNYVVPARDYSKDAHQLHAGLYEGPGLPLTDDEIRLLCAIQADGHVERGGQVDFCFHKTRKIGRLVEICSNLELVFSRVERLPRMRLRLHPSYVLDKLLNYLGEEKSFGSWVLNLSGRQADVLLEEVFHWDGCWTTRTNYSSSKKPNADWVQALFLLRGKRAKLRTYYPPRLKRPNFQVDVTYTDYSLTSNVRRGQLPPQAVYCVSVPSGFVLVRRNGRAVVTGQCQNIPEGDKELGPLLRGLFVARNPGWKFYSRDLSQIEFRLLVHFAVRLNCRGAKQAAQMYRDDPKTDFHIMVSGLTGLERKPAKTLNYGLVYQMGKSKLAITLGMVNPDGSPAPEALRIMESYHAGVPFVREFGYKASDAAQERGYVRTILKRRSRFNEWEPSFRDPSVQQRAGAYKAGNRILQGSAADLLKQAMVNLWESGLYREGGPITGELTVHDELTGSVDPGEAGTRALQQVDEAMMHAIPLEVPVLVSGGEGANWSEAH